MTVADSSTTLVREITINAAAAKVFAALTDPDQLPKWWGDDETYHCTHMERDLRVGGTWKTTGIGKDGAEFTVEGRYLSIDAPRLREYSWLPSFGTPRDAETVVRFELTERDGATQLRLTHSGFSSSESRDQHDMGWAQVLGWLAAYLRRRRALTGAAIIMHFVDIGSEGVNDRLQSLFVAEEPIHDFPERSGFLVVLLD
jgi:uncharacterized protein YndB with AHSA1/START domain